MSRIFRVGNIIYGVLFLGINVVYSQHEAPSGEDVEGVLQNPEIAKAPPAQKHLQKKTVADTPTPILTVYPTENISKDKNSEKNSEKVDTGSQELEQKVLSDSPKLSPAPSPIKVEEKVQDAEYLTGLEVIREIRAQYRSKAENSQDSWLPGARTMQLSFEKNPIAVRFWKHEERVILEMSFDLNGVQSSVLPMDNYGRLRKEALLGFNKSFVKVRLGTQKKFRTLYLTCDKKRCYGLWPGFPWNDKSLQILEFETNLQGMQGKLWKLAFNQAQKTIEAMPSESHFKKELEDPHYSPKNQQSHIKIRRQPMNYYFKDPFRQKRRKVRRFDDIEIQAQKPRSGIGYFDNFEPLLFQVEQGPVVFLISTKREFGVEAYELQTQQQIWIEPKTIVSLESTSLRKDSAHVRKIEFEAAK